MDLSETDEVERERRRTSYQPPAIAWTHELAETVNLAYACGKVMGTMDQCNMSDRS